MAPALPVSNRPRTSPGHASSLQVSLLLLGLLASCWGGSPPPAPAPPLDIAVVEHGHAAPLHAHVDKKCHVAEVELIAEVMPLLLDQYRS